MTYDKTDTTRSEQADRTDGDQPVTDNAERDVTAALERRDYLRSIGIAGLVGGLSGLGVTAGSTGTVGAQESWEADADERIEQYRMGDLEVVVETEDGSSVTDATVEIEQQEHEFGFGCMAHAEFLTRGSEWGEDIYTDEDQERYAETLEEHFNMIVLENLHKWNIWEDDTEIADDAVEWARERDMDVRGHVALWGNIDAHAIPPRVVEAMGEDWEEAGEPDHDPDYVVSESMDHIETIIEHYGDDITEWEIVNEVFHEPAMIEAVEGDNVTPETAEILGDWYEFGEEVADRYDIDIAVNDYNTLNGDHGYARDQYHDQIDYLMNERGIDLDGIGMQSHHYEHERIDPDTMMTRLDEYAEYGAGLKVTEFDMFGDGWDRQMQAEYLHQFLKTFFSHPEAEDFLMWGHWDPVHWGPEMGDDPDAPLYEEDWTEKPAYDEYVDLVFDEWWTDESGTTDASGEFETAVFHGDHEVTVTVNGESATQEVSVTDATSPVQLEITVDGDGEGDDDPVVGDYTPEDTTGDGLRNDFTGDGQTTHDDVTAFFENLEDDAVQQNAEDFDFAGNDEIGFADVVDLLHDV
ncbi:endo-1,4-beta-xylanase [Natronolimnobius sp. AArcel1]|uniref:endo-1,4-beta-xylanase n=1 Tax=Natronolimnobius sp. AArcel1 TaxID=1679093 RepID=UPI0013EAA1B8|nr:endo-1,4-beta-xylanase [Natronolimnobius sp. AArcel1]NGM68839.1 endo-1,4-beta-xylanase [Natronolimnobius sp. AArcel1]